MIKTLKDTVDLMNSEDYKERFLAEYKQLTIRYTGLKNMLYKWDRGELNFEPTCPRSIYNFLDQWKIILQFLKQELLLKELY